MLLTDYFRSEKDPTWDIALQCGVRHGVIRFPDDPAFDPSSPSMTRAVCDRFVAYGITPVVLEPLPNCLHDHIKTGDALRDESIEKTVKMLKNISELGINTLCFNFMAHHGWTRTASDIPERGGAKVTGFRETDFRPDGYSITKEKLWENYWYFIKAVLPYAERYGVRLALHPDDPPLDRLGSTERIMISYENIKKAVSASDSPYLGVTFCQACYHLMGESLEKVVPELREKIFFIHFRNVTGNKRDFRETFHDGGDIDMARTMRLYIENGIDVPIRVDHVPTLAGEDEKVAGYSALGRLYAIGYLRGLIEGIGSRA